MRKKALLFDLDNTILDFSKAEAHAMAFTIQHFQAFIENAELFEKTFSQINNHLWKKVHLGELSSHEVQQLRFSHLVDSLNLSIEATQIAQVYETSLTHPIFWLEQAEATMHQLKATHLLGIITNGFTHVQKPRLENSKLSAIASVNLIAEDVGIAKPDKRIFEMALDALQVAPQETLMVGDSLEADFQGALNANIDFCWINPANEPLLKHLPTPQITIHSIAQLPNYLS